MKKLLYSLLAVAALVAVPSCTKELTPVADPADGGVPVEVAFQLDLNNTMTKADNTALDDASGAWLLYVAAFSKSDGSLITTSKIGEDVVHIQDGTQSQEISLTLAQGSSYKVVFFAMKNEAYDVNFADNNVATFSYKSGLLANNGDLDAFFSTIDVSTSSSSTDPIQVSLKRPFAQINVLVKNEDVPQGHSDTFSSLMKVKAPKTFDLFAGKSTGDPEPIEFASAGIDTAPFGSYANTHTWVGMNYVLVTSANTVEVTSFQESGMSIAITPGTIPAKMNGRTNLVGNIYNLAQDYTFNVQIGQGFESETEEPVFAVQTEITLADNSTYTPDSPLTIDASTAATPQNVTLRVGGFTFAEVLEGAEEGAEIKAESADVTIATAAVNGNDVVITPVGNGETTITIMTPSFSKAEYRPATFVIPVKVEGMANQGGGGQGGGGQQGSGAIYEIDFTQGQGEFTSDDAVVTGSSTKVWTQSSSYGMVATAYVKLDGADAKSNNAAESSITSPLIDLGSAVSPIASFEHAVNYFTDLDKAKEETTVEVREQGGQWTKLEIAYPASLSFTYLSSGEISLAAYKGKKVEFRFTYKSTAEKAGTWEIKNFKVEDGSQPIQTTISFAKESLSLTVGSSATNAVTTNSTGAKTFTSSNRSVAEVDENGKVTAKAEGTATITVSIAKDGRYTAAEDSYPVTVTPASGDAASVGTVLWEETWTGGSDNQTVDNYEFGGTSVFGGATVSYSSAGGTKIYVDNNMDGSTSQENLMLGKKSGDVSGTWEITGIPTGKAKKAILKVYTNNANTFKSDLITLTSSTSGVTVGAKTQGTEAAKPFSFTFEIEFGTATSIDLLFTNGHSQNVRIDNITLTVTE